MGLLKIDRLVGDLPEQLHALYLREWWTHRRNVEDVRRMLEGSDVVIGFVDGSNGRLAGFARVITDFVYKALVLDVIVEEAYRGTGLGARLMDEVVGHPACATSCTSSCTAGRSWCRSTNGGGSRASSARSGSCGGASR